MKPKSEDQIASELSELYKQEFEGRRSGSFQLQREKFRQFAGRKRLEDAVVNRVAEKLLKRFKLVLVQGTGFYAVLSERQLDRVRVVPYQLLRARL